MSKGKIRFQVLSDIHAELAPSCVPLPADVDTAADVILIPGDIAHAANSVRIASRMFPETVIVAVAGNHEHYNTYEDIDDGMRVMRTDAWAETCRSGRIVDVLENRVVVIDVRGVRVRFLGCTLWTDFDLFGTPRLSERRVGMALNDYKAIVGRQRIGGDVLPNFSRAFTTRESLERFRASKAFLADALAKPHDGPTVVLTHHLPSKRSVSALYKKDPASPGFASNLDDLVGMGATLWVHGHTHSSCGYRDKGGTLVVCNPAGYARRRANGHDRENPRFDPNLVVDIRQGAPDGLWKAGIERKRIKASPG